MFTGSAGHDPGLHHTGQPVGQDIPGNADLRQEILKMAHSVECCAQYHETPALSDHFEGYREAALTAGQIR